MSQAKPTRVPKAEQQDEGARDAGDSSRRGEGEQRHAELPNAGPHAKPHLTNPDATPGSGALPPVGADEDGNMQPTS